MKKKVLFIILLLCLLLSSCSFLEVGNMFFDDNYAENTAEEIVDAIDSKNYDLFLKKFVKSVSSSAVFEDSVRQLFSFIEDKIENFTFDEHFTKEESEAGKRVKIYEMRITINTSSNKYYMYLQECIEDDYNVQNEGVVSLYVINAKDWLFDYEYYPQSDFLPGMHLE